MRLGPPSLEPPDGTNRYACFEGKILLGDEGFGALGFDEIAEVFSEHVDVVSDGRDKITAISGRVGNYFPCNYIFPARDCL